MLPAHFVTAGDVPLPIAEHGIQPVLTLRLLYRQGRQPPAAAGQLSALRGQQQTSAVRADVKAGPFHISVGHFIFLQIAPEEGFCIHPQRLR